MGAKVDLNFKIRGGDGLETDKVIRSEKGSSIKIGKLASAHIVINDPKVSRDHAMIRVSQSKELTVVDRGSANGTRVEGRRCSRAKLSLGSEIRIGDTTIVVGAVTEVIEAEPGVPAAVAAFDREKVHSPVAEVAGAASAPQPAEAAAPSFSPSFPDAPSTALGGGYPDDGSRVVEVSSFFEGSAVGVRQLDMRNSGKTSMGTVVLLILGWGGLAAGLFMAIYRAATALEGQAGHGGIGGLLAAIGVSIGVVGVARLVRERESPDFVIGHNPGSDLHLSHEAIPGPMFTLVTAGRGGYTLNYTDAMSGEVVLGGETQDLSSLARQGAPLGPAMHGQVRSYSIPDNSSIRLRFGSHAFLINSVPRFHVMKKGFVAGGGWRGQLSNLWSFLGHALLLLLMFSVPPDAKALSFDLFQTENKFVKYLAKPPEQREEEVPEWLKKKLPKPEKVEKVRPEDAKRKTARRPSDARRSQQQQATRGEGRPDEATTRMAEQAAQQAGVLSVLSSSTAGGGTLAAIFGQDSALGSDAESALGGLIGDELGESYGLGGLGIAGSGRGGGGTGSGTIGFGTLGTIGKGGGTGLSAGYRKAGKLGTRTARIPNVIAGKANVRGAMQKSVIRRVIRRNIRQIKYCYQRELQGNDKLGGRVVVRMLITATGQVGVAKIESSTLNNLAVESCIVQATRRWRFPKPSGGGIVIVKYPFILRSAGS